jgi:hypothetical protein
MAEQVHSPGDASSEWFEAARHAVAALGAAERGAGDAAAGDQVAGDDLEHLALAGHAGDRAEAPAQARRLDRLAHHSHETGRLEGVVGAESVGLLEDPLDDVGAAGERLRGALRARMLEPLLGQVDGHDPLRPGQPAAGHGAAPSCPRTVGA